MEGGGGGREGRGRGRRRRGRTCNLLSGPYRFPTTLGNMEFEIRPKHRDLIYLGTDHDWMKMGGGGRGEGKG